METVWHPPGTIVRVDMGAVFRTGEPAKIGRVIRCEVLPSSWYAVALPGGHEASGIPPEHVVKALTDRQQKLLDDIPQGGCFLHGADVTVARALVAHGLVNLEDNGAMLGVNGRSDRERWWCTPVHLGIGASS